MKLKDRVAIVTGGGKGIGAAISLALADEGAAVVVAARNLAPLEEVANQIRAQGGQAKVIQTDIADQAQAKRTLADTVKEFGKLDILINNAAYSHRNVELSELDLDFWQETIDVNVTGTMLCAREALRVMVPRRCGVIVNVESMPGMSGHISQPTRARNRQVPGSLAVDHKRL